MSSGPSFEEAPGVEKYLNQAPEAWISEHGWYVIEVKIRPPGTGEFQVIRWRRAAERTFAWLGRCRIHGRDCEWKTESSEARVQIGMIRLMLLRLAEERLRFAIPRSQARL
jgi:hypothetical protein